MNDQFDRVMPVVAGDAHLVDHTLYKEQSPSSRCLHAFQLRLQIRRIPALGRWRPTTSIGYAHYEVLISDEDNYLYRHLRSVLVAVFHGVHRNLGQGSAEVGVRPRGFGVGHAVSDLSSVTRVMSSTCSHSSPVKRASSERRKFTIAGPSERCAPTSPCKRGKPNICLWGSCASTNPSL